MSWPYRCQIKCRLSASVYRPHLCSRSWLRSSFCTCGNSISKLYPLYSLLSLNVSRFLPCFSKVLSTEQTVFLLRFKSLASLKGFILTQSKFVSDPYAKITMAYLTLWGSLRRRDIFPTPVLTCFTFLSLLGLACGLRNSIIWVTVVRMNKIRTKNLDAKVSECNWKVNLVIIK